MFCSRIEYLPRRLHNPKAWDSRTKLRQNDEDASNFENNVIVVRQHAVKRKTADTDICLSRIWLTNEFKQTNRNRALDICRTMYPIQGRIKALVANEHFHKKRESVHFAQGERTYRFFYVDAGSTVVGGTTYASFHFSNK